MDGGFPLAPVVGATEPKREPAFPAVAASFFMVEISAVRTEQPPDVERKGLGVSPRPFQAFCLPCQDNRMARERGRGYAAGMMELSYRRHRFPPVVIQHAVWLYLCFTLSYRDVEDLLAERGLDISYETVRSWVLKFGPVIARRLRRRRPRPSDRWHLDEMVVRVAGKRIYLWRAVDHEGEVLDVLVQSRRDSQAALRLMRKLLRKQGFAPKLLVTDK